MKKKTKRKSKVKTEVIGQINLSRNYMVFGDKSDVMDSDIRQPLDFGLVNTDTPLLWSSCQGVFATYHKNGKYDVITKTKDGKIKELKIKFS